MFTATHECTNLANEFRVTIAVQIVILQGNNNINAMLVAEKWFVLL